MRRRKLTKDPRTGTYYARVQVEKVIKKFCFSKNRRESEKALRELEEELSNGDQSLAAVANPDIEKGEPSDITIEDLITQYLHWVLVNRARSTYDLKKGILQTFLDRYGDCKVSDITYNALAKYYAWAKTTRGRTANGGGHHLMEVKCLFRWGEETDLCLCPVRRFPQIRHSPPATKKFTDEELPLLVQHSHPDFADMLVFGLLTGLRPHELRTLRKEYVQPIGENTCIVLEKHKTSMSARVQQPRVVPLSPDAITIIQRQAFQHSKSPFVFLNADGRPYTASCFRLRLKRVCDRAGIPQRTPYALRHYFGTKRAGEGLNQAILAQVMGHTTITTTTRYVAKVPRYQQEAMNAMATDLASLLGTAPAAPEPTPDTPTVEFPLRKPA